MLGVGRRELRRCLCICVKEFNMERAASKLCASLWAIIMSRCLLGLTTVASSLVLCGYSEICA